MWNSGFVPAGRDHGDSGANRVAHARTNCHDGRHIQPYVHAARRHHDVPLYYPQHSCGARKLHSTDDARSERCGIPANESCQLVSLGLRRSFPDWIDGPERAGHRVDVLHSIFNDNQQQCDRCDAGSVYPGFQFDLYRHQLHRHGAHNETERDDLVQDAVVPVVALFNSHYSGTGDTCTRHHTVAADRRTSTGDRRL